ncbi:hypothetical protein BGI41_02825 [Methanobrevibacter sp. 87.7]|uniref:Nif3-like dinuclear metal center hexameric protein n=1 Tax=Methanobrevibacter sp. 87.7 TaxID=387957 RepID=UPI000B50C020|nr:Nif3-like dinuclear metal center hexameric protein [Methanobrevibacter sp. 87.7]OWT33363.1 hypothetical protein BGI41_02825 [Methanobrevibacter sp. 87.7]
MKSIDLFNEIDKLIPKRLALKNDDIGYHGQLNPKNLNIEKIKIMMDLYPEYDNYNKNTLIITHHPPKFNPKTPNYTIHSNWDIIDGGANDALAESLNLKVIDYFDKNTKIGRICKGNTNIKELLLKINNNFRIDKNNNDINSVRIVNYKNSNIKNIAIISGFGLSNLEYIKLANKLNMDLLISGDLTQSGAVLARNLGISIIDTNHHSCEIPGLIKLKETIEKIGLPVEIIDTGLPWKDINLNSIKK